MEIPTCDHYSPDIGCIELLKDWFGLWFETIF